MNTQELMKQVMSRIEEAFTTMPDNHRSYEINHVEYVIQYNGWYYWSCIERDTESTDSFETLTECLQDAMEFERQATAEDKWKAEEEANDLKYGTYEEQKRKTYYSLTRG